MQHRVTVMIALSRDGGEAGSFFRVTWDRQGADRADTQLYKRGGRACVVLTFRKQTGGFDPLLSIFKDADVVWGVESGGDLSLPDLPVDGGTPKREGHTTRQSALTLFP